ncbi:MAG: hypothetical protein HQL23_02650 [Candidatus Omnitrophica bacterium]|nr:hypothetical protein [Candidatus Omnitrophota bacterium]
MRTATVIKIIFGVLFLLLMVFFIFENLDPVPIWIPMFKGRRIGMIYIILASYVFGFATAMWGMTVIGREIKRQQKAAEVPESEQALFEDEE